jgi:dehydrogenase/reductase SDR family protein 12
MSFGQFAASSQFYLFGKNHCTRTGWERAVAKYAKPDILENSANFLKDYVFMVSGANTGIGREVSTFLAKKGATVYMVCRSREKAEKARDEIMEIAKSSSVHVLQCDCSLERDVRRMWKEFEEKSKEKSKDNNGDGSAGLKEAGHVRLDGLLCNAGALSNEKTFTPDGVEVTFAAHLLFGTYLLGSLAMETLEATPNSRLVVVSRLGLIQGLVLVLVLRSYNDKKIVMIVIL